MIEDLREQSGVWDTIAALSEQDAVACGVAEEWGLLNGPLRKPLSELRDLIRWLDTDGQDDPTLTAARERFDEICQGLEYTDAAP